MFNFCFERYEILNPLSTNSKKWSNTLKQTNCLGVFDHFVGLALEGLNIYIYKKSRLAFTNELISIELFQANITFLYTAKTVESVWFSI